MTISGGTFLFDHDLGIRAADESGIVILGNDFNLPVNEPIQDPEGTITGKLAGGSPIEWSFQRDATATIVLLPFVGGDYNADGVLNVADIDLQTHAMSDPDPDLTAYDENDDGVVDGADRLIWVHEHAGTWIGDANLDGEFNSGDMVQVFNVGKYETDEQAGWAEGDWSADGLFDSSDMVTAFADGGYEKGPRMDAVAVPEPAVPAVTWLGLAMLLFRYGWRR